MDEKKQKDFCTTHKKKPARAGSNFYGSSTKKERNKTITTSSLSFFLAQLKEGTFFCQIYF
jgi:hypothetical protein